MKPLKTVALKAHWLSEPYAANLLPQNTLIYKPLNTVSSVRNTNMVVQTIEIIDVSSLTLHRKESVRA